MPAENLAGLRMVAVGNIVFAVGGAAAYWMRLSLSMTAVLALVVILGAVLDLRHSNRNSMGMDRALSFVVGALSLNAVLVVLPYLTVGADGSLWDSRFFFALDLMVAAGGLVLVNHAIFTAAGSVATAQLLAQIQLGLVAGAILALYYLPDGTWVPVEVNGHMTRMLDLQWSPAIAAIGALAWAVPAFARPAAVRAA